MLRIHRWAPTSVTLIPAVSLWHRFELDVNEVGGYAFLRPRPRPAGELVDFGSTPPEPSFEADALATWVTP